MSALILYCATSMLHVLHRHAPDLIDIVVPVSHLTGRYYLRLAQEDLFAAFRHICSFCERKLIQSHPSNSRNPFFQPNCKSIMVMPMIVKEFDNCFANQLTIFSVQISSKIVNFVFHPKCQISQFC